MPAVVNRGISDDMPIVSKLTQQKQLYKRKPCWLMYALIDESPQNCHLSVMWQEKRSHTSAPTGAGGKVPTLVLWGQASSSLEQDLHV